MRRGQLKLVGEKFVKKLLKKARNQPVLAKKLGKLPASLEFKFVSQAVMKKLNSAYRGKNYATDVLSFPTPKIFRSQGLLGELIICTRAVSQQANEHGHSEEIELKILLVHGFLHLLDFDHEKGRASAKKMAFWEEKLLGKAGARSLIARSNSGKMANYEPKSRPPRNSRKTS